MSLPFFGRWGVWKFDLAVIVARENAAGAATLRRPKAVLCIAKHSHAINTATHSTHFTGIAKSPRMSRQTEWMWFAGLPAESACVLTNSIWNDAPWMQ